jgi:hypothetical protein
MSIPNVSTENFKSDRPLITAVGVSELGPGSLLGCPLFIYLFIFFFWKQIERYSIARKGAHYFPFWRQRESARVRFFSKLALQPSSQFRCLLVASFVLSDDFAVYGTWGGWVGLMSGISRALRSAVRYRECSLSAYAIILEDRLRYLWLIEGKSGFFLKIKEKRNKEKVTLRKRISFFIYFYWHK